MNVIATAKIIAASTRFLDRPPVAGLLPAMAFSLVLVDGHHRWRDPAGRRRCVGVGGNGAASSPTRPSAYGRSMS
jgi:hypothetical protein